jgi:hypothetical protein
LKRQLGGAIGFRRGWFLLLFLAFILPALSAEAFQRGGIPQTGFDRGGVAYRRAPGGPKPATSVKETAKARLEAGYGRFPLLFEKNEGQTAPEVAFTVKGSEKTLYFTPEGLTFSLTMPRDVKGKTSGREKTEGRKNHGLEASNKRWTLKLDFPGAGRVRPEGENPAETVLSYFKGPESERRTGVPAYNSIVYRDLWPGIDLVYGGDANHLKYRFVVRPGADPDRIRLAYRGAERLKVNGDGGLEIVTAAGVLRDDAPVSWQETEEGRVPVNVSYTIGLSDAGSPAPGAPLDYGFLVESYDPARELVIDPVVLVYCGFIGGEGNDSGYGIAVDGAGNAYVTGATKSDKRTFPVTVGPDVSHNGNYDAFVAKVNAAGTELVYCGYIGGQSFDAGHGIAVDGAGNAYVTGDTNSDESTFPVTAGPGVSHNGSADAFVAKVNADGTELVYCGYIGGQSFDAGHGIAVDGAGNAYVTGLTKSDETTFPVSVGPGVSHNGGDDTFVAKLSADGAGLVYCGYIGGSGDDWVGGIAVDGAGNAYVTGWTESDESTFPVTDGPDLTYNGGGDAFVAKISGGAPLSAAAILSAEDFRVLCREGTADEVRAAINAGADVKGKKGEPTPLHWAGLNPNPGVISALVKAGADVNARSNDGATPLHFAAANNSASEAVSQLLKAGAKANARDKDGRTPLHLAAQNNANPEMTELLLEAGADAKAKDASGMRPIDYAEKNPGLMNTEAYWTLNDASY